MRSRPLFRSAALLVALVVLQGGSSALAAEPGRGGSRSGAIDSITPFAQGASTLTGMAQPFYNAFSQAVSPAPRA
ncbi:hypothetical protein ACIP4U_31700 [Streptomyces caelestis]|jgi:hypothetical protein|uniref:Uncharacterized protein n=1 Tax=Streptomyces caelestis TaxID=36816 RepID=A0A7W9H5R1_9ACTN|nr:hypothetical protein [Streptomyces caelestis]MBB5795976.1 hypothetical protein [Streptomyces caelestis]GGW44364.1 hypothetical protein GCM10010320_25930 [Streptomyces caelestis]